MGPEMAQLVESWKEEVNRLRTRYKDEVRARVLEVAADELEETLQQSGRRVLSLEEASLWSGYSRSHLRALQRNGTLAQAGRKGKPGFRQYELPVKAGHEPVPPENVRAMKRRRRSRFR